MKNMSRWVTVAISKFPVEVYFAYCQCAAGKPRTCSHVFALFKLLAKWAIEKVNYVPTPVACASRPCTWSVVQSRGRVVKPAIADLTITAPKRQNKEETTTSKKLKGIKSTLYDARSTTTRIVNYEKLDKLMLTLKNENPSVPALMAINQDATQPIHTQFDEMSLGSLLSLHLPLIPPNFNIYCSVDLSVTPAVGFYIYPPFPCNDSENKMNPYLKNISVEKKQFLEDLRISRDDVEQRTRMQVDEPEWFDLRKHRLTTSLNKKLCNVKTERGFNTLAKNIATKPNPSKFLQYKLNFGRYHDILPLHIALQQYEKFMKSKQHHIQVENIGLVIDYENYILGATPDGKVVDPTEIYPYGIIEIKCSEEYKNNDPLDICLFSRKDNFNSIQFNFDFNSIHPELSFNDIPVAGKEFTNHLGLYFDERRSFAKHVRESIRKAKKGDIL